jgi:antitoxin HicB
MRRYTIVLIPDLEEGGYTVKVPALPEAVTEGDTIEEALANARDVIRLCLEERAANREPIPQETMPAEVPVLTVDI